MGPVDGNGPDNHASRCPPDLNGGALAGAGGQRFGGEQSVRSVIAPLHDGHVALDPIDDAGHDGEEEERSHVVPRAGR
jgi:hypothetical protein